MHATPTAISELDPPTGRISLYLELSKARLTSLVLATTFVGFMAGAGQGTFSLALFLWTMIGTALTAASANSLNQCWEYDRDLKMERTRNRPIPSGRLSLKEATLVSALAGLLGIGILFVFVNPLTGFLGLLNLLIYVLIYTPLKSVTTLCTLVGAICGAIPPMMGWAGALNSLGAGAWILGGILFVWQIPHFMALAWMYREDYERGGYQMLPVVDRQGRLTFQVILLYSLVLIPLGMTYFLLGLGGYVYLMGSLLCGGVMVWLSMVLAMNKSEMQARRVFLASLLYLPILLGLMILDASSADRSVQMVQEDRIVQSTLLSRNDPSILKP